VLKFLVAQSCLPQLIMSLAFRTAHSNSPDAILSAKKNHLAHFLILFKFFPQYRQKGLNLYSRCNATLSRQTNPASASKLFSKMSARSRSEWDRHLDTAYAKCRFCFIWESIFGTCVDRIRYAIAMGQPNLTQTNFIRSTLSPKNSHTKILALHLSGKVQAQKFMKMAKDAKYLSELYISFSSKKHILSVLHM
jgi:hypothetical protein